MRLIVCMFVLCIAYVCKPMLQLRPAMALKIATPTALSASAFRPGIFPSVAQLQWGNC